MHMTVADAGDVAQWDGFYGGLSLGAARTGASSETKTTYVAPGASLTAGTFWTTQRNADEVARLGTGSVIGTNFSAGAALGYNWRIDSNQVFGTELGINSLGFNKRLARSGTYITPSNFLSSLIPTVTVQPKADYFIDLTARYGRIFDHTLFFVKGGAALGQVGYSYSLDDTFSKHSHSYDNFKLGWTVGFGVERYVGNDWIFRLEYQHVDFGKIASSGSNIVSQNGNSYRNTTIGVGMRLSSDIVKVGLYRAF